MQGLRTGSEEVDLYFHVVVKMTVRSLLKNKWLSHPKNLPEGFILHSNAFLDGRRLERDLGRMEIEWQDCRNMGWGLEGIVNGRGIGGVGRGICECEEIEEGNLEFKERVWLWRDAIGG